MRLSSKILPTALASAAIAVALVQCATQGEDGQYFQIPPRGWAYGDTLAFAPADHADTIAPGPVDIAIAIRNSASYQYSNIWLELTYARPDSTLQVDTIDFRLADDYGHWHGKGIGVGFQHVDTVARQALIDPARPITLRHIMRVDTLPGIEQVAIILKK